MGDRTASGRGGDGSESRLPADETDEREAADDGGDEDGDDDDDVEADLVVETENRLVWLKSGAGVLTGAGAVRPGPVLSSRGLLTGAMLMRQLLVLLQQRTQESLAGAFRETPHVESRRGQAVVR